MRTFGNSNPRGRRSTPRTRVPAFALLSAKGRQYSAELIDVSRTGARLKGGIFPDAAEPLTFEAEKVKTACEIVWLEGDQCAVAFDTPIAATEVRQIRALTDFVRHFASPGD